MHNNFINDPILNNYRKSYMEIGEAYFWTSTIHEWKHLLKEDSIKDILINSLRYLVLNEYVKVYGFTIMPNHIHLIWELLKYNGKEKPDSSFQKKTAHDIKKGLKRNNNKLIETCYVNEIDREYRIWQRDPLAIHISGRNMLEQKLNYTHNNPLQDHWNLAKSPEEYRYSSASFYEKGKSEWDFLTHYRDAW